MSDAVVELIAKVGIAAVNHMITRAMNDPISKDKILRGEELDIEDFRRLGIERDASGNVRDDTLGLGDK